MTAPPPAGWYPDPERVHDIRYWDGAMWTARVRKPGPTDSALDVVAGTAKLPFVKVLRGLGLILLALFFGFLAYRGLTDNPADWDVGATQSAVVIWRSFFGVMLAMCLVALILGALTLARPALRPRYGVIAGVSVVVVGLLGCLLAFLPVSVIDSPGSLIGYVGIGFPFAVGGAITTLLSAIDIAGRKTATVRPQRVELPRGARRATVGRRLLARLIDAVLVGIVAVPLAVLAERNSIMTIVVPYLICGMLAFGYFVAFEASHGWTPGKMLLGMRVYGSACAAKPTVRQASIRNAFALLGIVPLMGPWLVLVAGGVIAYTIHASPTGQGEHDQLAGGTRVVKT